MNKAAVFGVLVCGLILSGSVTAVVAQEEGAVKVEADAEYAFGTVKKVDADQILVTEFDYDTGEEKDVRYEVDSKTQVNGASLRDIAPGDEVDVDFIADKTGKNKAVVLSVAKPVEGEGKS